MTEKPEQRQADPGHISRLFAKITPLPVWWPLPACALIGTLCAGSYTMLKTPEYTATSYVVAAPVKDGDPGAALGYAQAYGRIATSDSTLAYARVAAGISAQTLRTHVQTETSPDSPMIAITGTSTRPSQAADIANAVADAVFVSSNGVSKNTGVKLLHFSQAITPTQQVSPSVPISVAVGACAGGLIGGLVLLVRPRRHQWTASTSVPAPAHAVGSATAERERV